MSKHLETEKKKLTLNRKKSPAEQGSGRLAICHDQLELMGGRQKKNVEESLSPTIKVMYKHIVSEKR